MASISEVVRLPVLSFTMKNKLHGSIVFRLFLSILILVQADTDSSPLLHVTLTSHSDSSTRVGVAEWKSEWNHLENATTLKVAFFSPVQDNDLEYRRTSVTTSEAHSTLWRGMLLPDRNETGFSTIYKDVDGSIGGFFTSKTLSMELVQHSNGDLVVHSTDWKDVAHEEGDNHLEEKDFSRTRRVSEHKLVAEFATRFEQDQCGGQQVTKRDLEIVQSPPRRLDEEKSDPVVVDVLLLVTNRAMCSHAEERYGCEPTQRNRGPIERSLRIAHDQTNEAMRNVGALVQTRIVQIVYLDPSYDGRPNPETANFLYLDQRVESWRVATGGDLTMLIAGTDPDWNGYATFFRGTAVVAHDRLRSYTYAHEMGRKYCIRYELQFLTQIKLLSLQTFLRCDTIERTAQTIFRMHTLIERRTSFEPCWATTVNMIHVRLYLSTAQMDTNSMVTISVMKAMITHANFVKSLQNEPAGTKRFNPNRISLPLVILDQHSHRATFQAALLRHPRFSHRQM